MRINTSHIIFLIFLQLAIFASLLPVFFLMDTSSDLYRNIVFVVFLECVGLAFIDKEDSIYKIFLFMMFIFNIALPILVLFDLYSYPPGNRIMIGDGIKLVVSDKTLSETYQVLISMIMGTSVGWLIGKYHFDKNHNNSKNLTSTVIYSDNFISNIKYLFFILTLMVIYRNSILVYYSLSYGFVEVMHLRSNDLGISWVFTLADALFKMFGFAILYQSRNHKEYIKYAAIFMVPFIIQAVTGARGEAIAMLIVVLFIYSDFYNQLKLTRIIFTTAVIFFTSVTIGAVRTSTEIGDVFANVSIFDLMLLILTSTSGSIGVIAYTIELKDQFFNSTPFLFGYIQGIFSFSPNYTYEGILDKNYLAQHITYITEPAKLFNGSTIGTAMGAEFYEFSGGSMIVIFILSVMLLYFAKYFMSKINKNIIMFYIGALYFEALLLSPRGSIMKVFSKETIFSILILIFMVFLAKSYKRIEK